MGSQGVQAHDIIPLQVYKRFKDDFIDFLPGWSTAGEYNYKASPSTQIAARQMNSLLHSGSHPWINKTLITLLERPEFVNATDEVKTVRLAQLVNFMSEASDLEAKGAKTGGYVAFTSRRDPTLIAEKGYRPSKAEMYTDAKKYITWSNITESDAGKAVEALDVRVNAAGKLEYNGTLGNSSIFSKSYDEIDDFKTYGASGSRGASSKYSAEYVESRNIKAFGDGSITVDGQPVNRTEAKAFVDQEISDGKRVSSFDKVPKAFTKFPVVGAAAMAAVLLPSASIAGQAQDAPAYDETVHNAANKAFISEVFGQVVSGVAGAVAGTVAALMSFGLATIPAAVAASIAGEPVGKWLGNQFYDLFPETGNDLAEFLVPIGRNRWRKCRRVHRRDYGRGVRGIRIHCRQNHRARRAVRYRRSDLWQRWSAGECR